MWVVKLGGSLLGASELKGWLDVLAGRHNVRLVIVPGGGIFAEAVREAQSISGFGDAEAHHLALLAMDQYALALNAMQPSLRTASTDLEIIEGCRQHRVILWLPSKMVLANETLPKSWELTSDSIAAWLAAKLHAERLVLVKTIPPPEDATTLDQLSLAGYVDACFPEYASHLGCPIQFMHRASFKGFADVLAGVSLPRKSHSEEESWIN